MELAILGTVLLFAFTLLLRYGMNANYQQRLEMEGFRKAFARAAQYDPDADFNRNQFNPDNSGWEYENSEPSMPSNHWRNVTYSVIEDKPMISGAGLLPIVERTPIGISEEAVCSIDLFAEMKYGDEKDLPRVEFEINGRRYSFTTAGFCEYPEHDNMRMKKEREDWDGSGLSWKWETVSEVEPGDLVDVDNDGEEEYIISRKCIAADSESETADSQPEVCSGYWILQVLDSQEGQIDTSGEEGVLQGYSKKHLVNNSTLGRQETTSSITTNENMNAREIFTRIFRTQDGGYNAVDTFSDKSRRTWTTPIR